MKRFIAIVMVFSGIASATVVMLSPPAWLTVRRIHVVGGADLPGHFIHDIEAELEVFRGRPIWDVSLRMIQGKITEMVWVRELHIQRQFPDAIRVTVHEKSAVAGLPTLDGLRLVYSDGLISKPLPFAEAPSVPILEGQGFEEEEALTAAVRTLSALPKTGGVSHQTVTRVLWDKTRSDVKLFLRKHIAPIYLGQASPSVRASRVEKVLEYLRSQKIKGRVIDADFGKKVLVKLDKGR